MSRGVSGEEVRETLSHLPDIAAQESLAPPPLQQVYVPTGHHQALSLDTIVVVGMRGAGKSLWTAVLSTERYRRFVGAVANNPGLQQAEVRVGFGLDSTNTLFPSDQVLAQLVNARLDPFCIWQTVVLRHAVEASGLKTPAFLLKDWLTASQNVAQDPAGTEKLLAACDQRLSDKRTTLLVLFDALDRLGPDWQSVRALLTGALRFALAARTRKAIRTKFFLRPDMEEDGEIWRFADSSKLRHSRVELNWKSADLYALVLTYVANNEQVGAAFRGQVATQSGVLWPEQDGLYPIPRGLVSEDVLLRQVMDGITGPWMGRDRKRGFTYTWIPTHLADAAGRISPRSFLLAFRHAAQQTAAIRPTHKLALHFEAIQLGVAEASRIRIAEIKEDYPWVDPLLEAARGLSVPCAERDLIQRWTPKQIQGVRTAARKLPPRRFTTDPTRRGETDALVDDLVELAVLYRTQDGRLNIPDIFRVGFGVRRKGGVKPPR